jgi:hypothetical protein
MRIIDPIEDPLRYGPGKLAGQMKDLGMPKGKRQELNRALKSHDFIAIATILRGLGEPKFKVLEEGDDILDVPFLILAAPDAPKVSLKATLSTTEVDSGGATFKVAGTGFSADVELSIKQKFEINAGAGEIQKASFKVPVRWEKRSVAGNEDRNWIHVEPIGRTKRSDIEVTTEKVRPDTRNAPGLEVSMVKAGSQPASVQQSHTLEGGIGFNVGLKNEAIGIEATMTAKTENAMNIDLTANLPSGYIYRISWLDGPPGVDVAASRSRSSR